MITYKDIKRSINNIIFDNFQGIEINSNDVKEGFTRPSFFIWFDNQVRSSNTTQVQKSFTVRINYFPTDIYDYSLEIMDVQETLENAFDLKLPVLDRQFNIMEAESVMTDGVLEFSFDLDFFDGKEDNTIYNPVETLDFTTKKG